jgi:hypothetical protein
VTERDSYQTRETQSIKGMIRSSALRVIGIEYLQNLPVLVGLGYALGASDWYARVTIAALGAIFTAVVIAQTEGWKRGKDAEHPERLIDTTANALIFFIGLMLYVVYYFLIRSSMSNLILTDIIAGCLLGGAGGLLQAFFVAERQLTTSALAHAVALALAAAILLVLIGISEAVLSPLPMALALCVPMTLIIVRFDYWSLVCQSGAAL